jgi:hypothetical protein
MATRLQRVGCKVRLPAQLYDPLGDHVSLGKLLIRVQQELLGNPIGAETACHGTVQPVAQHAHQFGGERIVQPTQHRLAIAAVGVGRRRAFQTARRLGRNPLAFGE